MNSPRITLFRPFFGEFINYADVKEVRLRSALTIKNITYECYLRIAQFDVVKEIPNLLFFGFFIFYILALVLPRTGIPYWDTRLKQKVLLVPRIWIQIRIPDPESSSTVHT